MTREEKQWLMVIVTVLTVVLAVVVFFTSFYAVFRAIEKKRPEPVNTKR